MTPEYLAGLFDGEGTVTFSHNVVKTGKRAGRKQLTCQIRIGNTNSAFIDATESILTDLGIEYRRYEHLTSRGKPWYMVSVHKAEAMRRFHDLVPFLDVGKRAKLVEALAWKERNAVSI